MTGAARLSALYQVWQWKGDRKKMDDIDIAQQRQAEEIRRALAARGNPAGPARATCVDCGETIPEQRRTAAPGCVRCFGCQAARERGR